MGLITINGSSHSTLLSPHTSARAYLVLYSFRDPIVCIVPWNSRICNGIRLGLCLVRVKWLTGKCFSENDLRENILREKKKKNFFFSVKCFTDLKSVRHFIEKWLDFSLTTYFLWNKHPKIRKTFFCKSFSVKQTDPKM